MLGKVQTSGGTTAQQHVFYTALYHALLHPNVFSDTNGQYMGFDNAVHSVAAGHAQYANYSGWDIYRSQAQLIGMVAPSQASDVAQSAVNDYAQSTRLPKWAQANGESYVMVGDPADSIIADIYAFGGRGFDTAAAKTAMVHEATVANNVRPGLSYLDSIGYLPSDGSYGCCNYYGSVSTTLEYNTADFALGAFAGALGDSANQKKFADRAQDWKNVLNTSSGFVQPRTASGGWAGGFSPTSGDNMVEGTSWQYTGMVPFNVRGLADAKGGNAGMVSYLDHVLGAYNGSGGDHADLGNEPSVELPWEYDYVGQPWKTQSVIRNVQNQLWPDSPTGWGVGNDDLGTMSAWYVWSAMGIFPETPGHGGPRAGQPAVHPGRHHAQHREHADDQRPGRRDQRPVRAECDLERRQLEQRLPAALRGDERWHAQHRRLARPPTPHGRRRRSSAPPSYPGSGASGGKSGPITSGIAGKCVDVSNSGTANGTAIQIYTCNGTNAQKWTVPGDGTLTAFGKCLDVNNSGTANGTKVQLYDCNGTGAQQWTYSASAKSLTNPQSGKCLDDPNSSTTDGTQLQIYTCNGSAAQQWTLPS